ncbi:phosphoribosyltransferase [Undibacterium arcticum]|uniref:Phosphoribosyltransferase n=1 Tax=Undibacterium arcticum TaxID=1762892 RepID=A0ABV7F6D3_9BURK
MQSTSKLSVVPPASNEKDLWVSWDGYHRLIERLALQVHESGWKFDQILCLARGGLRPGDLLSRIFDVQLAILSTSSYRETADAQSNPQRGELDIARNLTLSKGTLSGKVLLVDDLIDSGVTLDKVQRHLSHNFGAVTEVKSAVIWCKAGASMRPDFCAEYLVGDPWIHQPFEEYDALHPHMLSARLRRHDAE